MRLVSLVFLTLCSGCAARLPPQFVADPGVHVVRDTAAYENTLSGGEFGLLVRDGLVVDSIDLHYGVHRLNSGAVTFLPVTPSDDAPDALDVTEHVVFDGRKAVPLNTFLPDFSDYFSSPTVLDGMVYYWGLERIGAGEYRVHARRYDAQRRKIDSCFLVATEVATDYRGHFATPVRKGDWVAFDTFGHEFLVTPDLTRVLTQATERRCSR